MFGSSPVAAVKQRACRENRPRKFFPLEKGSEIFGGNWEKSWKWVLAAADRIRFSGWGMLMEFAALVDSVLGLSWGQIIPSGAITAVIGAVWGWRKERFRRSDELRDLIRDLVQARREEYGDADIRWQTVYDRFSHPFFQSPDKSHILAEMKRVRKELLQSTRREGINEAHEVVHRDGSIAIDQLESSHRRLRKVSDDLVLDLKKFNAEMDRLERKFRNPWTPM